MLLHPLQVKAGWGVLGSLCPVSGLVNLTYRTGCGLTGNRTCLLGLYHSKTPRSCNRCCNRHRSAVHRLARVLCSSLSRHKCGPHDPRRRSCAASSVEEIPPNPLKTKDFRVDTQLTP